jgi:hypothetical protein
LQNKIDTHEFDYNQGIAFSSKSNEKLKISLKVPQDGDYYLEIRSMNASGSGDLKINFNDSNGLIKRNKANEFEWYENGPISLKAGSYSLNLENSGGFQVLNTAALVSIDEMKKADQLTKNFYGYFQHFDLSDQNDKTKFQKLLENNKWENLENGQAIKKGWIIYTDSYNPAWVLHKGQDDLSSFPMYSMINGFYVDPEWGKTEITFKGQDDLKWGIYFSGISLMVIIISVLFIVERKSKRI